MIKSHTANYNHQHHSPNDILNAIMDEVEKGYALVALDNVEYYTEAKYMVYEKTQNMSNSVRSRFKEIEDKVDANIKKLEILSVTNGFGSEKEQSIRWNNDRINEMNDMIFDGLLSGKKLDEANKQIEYCKNNLQDLLDE